LVLYTWPVGSEDEWRRSPQWRAV